MVCTGSTMDAMSDAIDSAEVMLYTVSIAYKESANVSKHASKHASKQASAVNILVWHDTTRTRTDAPFIRRCSL